MRSLLFSVSLILVLSVGACAQNVAPKPLPDAPGKSLAQGVDYSQEAYVVELLRTSYRFENDGTGRKEVTARVKVQSEAGVEQWGQLVMGYSSANERVEVP